jgi:hypothetical protein
MSNADVVESMPAGLAPSVHEERTIAVDGGWGRSADFADEVPTFAPTQVYELYGLTIASDVELPMDPLNGTAASPVDIVVRRVPSEVWPPSSFDNIIGALRCSHGTITVARYDDDRGTWLHFPSVGAFNISSDGSRVDVHALPHVDEDLLPLMLLGPVLTFALHRRGIPCLHASAVATEHGAAVFFGPKGRGKTTMAASFLSRGASLVTDDALPLRVDAGAVYGVPSLPLMKVWRETADQGLGIVEALPSVSAHIEKMLLRTRGRYPSATQPVRIGAMYILDRAEGSGESPSEMELTSLRGAEGVAALFAQTSIVGLLAPSETPMLLRMYSRLVAQAPVKLLRYPNGFEHQDAVHASILSDMAGQS